MIFKNSFLTQHLRAVRQSYLTHFCDAVYFAANFLIASLVVLLHAVLPFIFTNTGSSMVKKIVRRIAFKVQISSLEANQNNKNIAIIGCGFSGVLSFFNLVKNYQPKAGSKLEIDVFEKSPVLAKGIAYSTKSFHHLLNVPAQKMGAVDNNPRHFYEWLMEKGYPYGPNDFVPRQIFGLYLEDLLKIALEIAEKKNVLCRFIHQEITEIKTEKNYYIIDEKPYNHCVLASGIKIKNREYNLWNVDLGEYLSQKEIHIIGCGLTAFDAVMSLRDLNYQGKIFLHSRSGKMPHPHKITEITGKVVAPLDIADADLPLSEIFHKFVANCRATENWRHCFDAFRPITQQFWMALSLEKQQRFFRHCLRFWSIHRHRCPEQQFAAIEKMVKAGQVVFSREKPPLQTIEKNLDCTGFDHQNQIKLVENLIASDVVKLDELRVGIKSLKDNFYIVGGLNFGNNFEILAVPDIAPQTYQIAKKILGV